MFDARPEWFYDVKKICLTHAVWHQDLSIAQAQAATTFSLMLT